MDYEIDIQIKKQVKTFDEAWFDTCDWSIVDFIDTWGLRLINFNDHQQSILSRDPF